MLYLDAPMSGGMTRAANGELTVMASGSLVAFALADPILDIMASTVYRLGDTSEIVGVPIAAACGAITFAPPLLPASSASRGTSRPSPPRGSEPNAT